MTTDHIEGLSYMKGSILTPLKLVYKLQVCALLAFYHVILHKNNGDVNITFCTLLEFKELCNSAYCAVIESSNLVENPRNTELITEIEIEVGGFAAGMYMS